MRADDPNWINYWPFEKTLMESLTAKILSNTFDEVYGQCEKRLAREIYGNIPVQKLSSISELPSQSNHLTNSHCIQNVKGLFLILKAYNLIDLYSKQLKCCVLHCINKHGTFYIAQIYFTYKE